MADDSLSEQGRSPRKRPLVRQGNFGCQFPGFLIQYPYQGSVGGNQFLRQRQKPLQQNRAVRHIRVVDTGAPHRFGRAQLFAQAVHLLLLPRHARATTAKTAAAAGRFPPRKPRPMEPAEQRQQAKRYHGHQTRQMRAAVGVFSSCLSAVKYTRQ